MIDVKKKVMGKLAAKTGYLPNCPKLGPTQSLAELNINLFDSVAIATEIAEEINLDIDWDYAPLETIGDLIKLIEGCLAAPAQN